MHVSDFLQALYRNAQGYAEIRLIHKSGDWQKAQKIYRPADAIHTGDFDVLAEYNQEHGYHIYHRINVSSTQDSKKANISQITALYIDVDDNSEEALARIYEMWFPPTAIIASGGGYHAYWFLREPLTIPDMDAVYEIERTMQGMCLAYGEGADTKAKDITRILRTPSFHNIKDEYDPYPLCEVIYYDDWEGMRYGFHELYRVFAALGAPKKVKPKRHIPSVAYSNELPKWVNEYLESGAGHGERNTRLYAAARAFLDVGKTQYEAEQTLMSRALADGLPQGEARNAINSAFRASPNPSMNNRQMSARYAIGDAVGSAK